MRQSLASLENKAWSKDYRADTLFGKGKPSPAGLREKERREGNELKPGGLENCSQLCDEPQEAQRAGHMSLSLWHVRHLVTGHKENHAPGLPGEDNREGIYLPGYLPLPGSRWSNFVPQEMNSLTCSSYIKRPPQLLEMPDLTTWCMTFHPSLEWREESKTLRAVWLGCVCVWFRGEESMGLSRELCCIGEQAGDGSWVAEGPMSGQWP